MQYVVFVVGIWSIWFLWFVWFIGRETKQNQINFLALPSLTRR